MASFQRFVWWWSTSCGSKESSFGKLCSTSWPRGCALKLKCSEKKHASGLCSKRGAQRQRIRTPKRRDRARYTRRDRCKRERETVDPFSDGGTLWNWLTPTATKSTATHTSDAGEDGRSLDQRCSSKGNTGWSSRGSSTAFSKPLSRELAP